jgi:hypothetical protein
MAYKNTHSTDLVEIIKLLKEGKILGVDESLDKFKKYLDTIQDIGSFNTVSWSQIWRKNVWAFGEQFKKLNPQEFLQQVDNKLISSTITNIEVLEFIRSEIAFNYLPDNECKKQIKKLIEKYPLNSEFRHTLGHYYNQNEKLKAIAEYKLALKIEPENKDYLKSRFNAENDYLNNLIAEGNYIIGQEYVKSVFDEEFYITRDVFYHNGFIDYQSRFSDHIIFQTKLKVLEEDFKTKIHSELDSERRRIIEVLGFFSAIVAFILSTVSIGNKYPFIQAIYFILALGIILIMFAVTLSTLFSSNKITLLKEKKFWVLIIGLSLLFILIITTDTNSSTIKKTEPKTKQASSPAPARIPSRGNGIQKTGQPKTGESRQNKKLD